MTNSCYCIWLLMSHKVSSIVALHKVSEKHISPLTTAHHAKPTTRWHVTSLLRPKSTGRHWHDQENTSGLNREGAGSQQQTGNAGRSRRGQVAMFKTPVDAPLLISHRPITLFFFPSTLADSEVGEAQFEKDEVTSCFRTSWATRESTSGDSWWIVWSH